MMADGGFSVEGNENVQEILSKQLYLCQFMVALGIVRTKGGLFTSDMRFRLVPKKQVFEGEEVACRENRFL